MANQEIVLKRSEADALLRDRRKIVAIEGEVALAKLVYAARFDELQELRDQRSSYQEKYPWLSDPGEEIPEHLMGDGKRMSDFDAISLRYDKLTDRIDIVVNQLFNAPKALQGAMELQANTANKSGQMMSASMAFAYLNRVAGAAAQYIEAQGNRDRYLEKVNEIILDFMRDNPHLGMGEKSGE